MEKRVWVHIQHLGMGEDYKFGRNQALFKFGPPLYHGNDKLCTT